MTKNARHDCKADALRKQGTFNRRAERVNDELFHRSAFFDPRDLPQVKYEMLRRVREQGVAVARAAKSFGFSRPSFYEAKDAFESDGLSGLLPKKRGPRHAHKLTQEVLIFIDSIRAKDPSVTELSLASLIKERFDIDVHPRSVERAVARREKKQK